MEPLPAAPPVVAVVVTSDPGPWLEESLASLGAQDYPNLSVLVVDSGSAEDPANRVGACLPDAFVARLDQRADFGTAANQALTLVDGAAFYLLCHDDVALDPRAVRIMVDEALRSNAGIVTPKVVEWDRPERLVAVGVGADRQGVLHPLVEPGELDQEQHDAVRDVFVAPGGVTLVRADLFASLGGYRPDVAQFGEDLDLSWRVQVAGARVVAAPGAVVRHRQAERSGERRGWTSPSARRRAEELTEQHRVRTLLTCYSTVRLVRLAPMLVAYLLGEVVFELLRGHAGQAGATLRAAWRGATGGTSLKKDRHAVQRVRTARDGDIARLQARGNVRLRGFLRTLVEDGPLPGVPVPLDDEEAEAAATRHAWEDPASSDGAAMVPVTQVRRRGQRLSAEATASLTSSIGRGSWRLPVGFGLAILLVLLIGSRSLLGKELPGITQMPTSAGGIGAWWHAWWSNVSDGGTGGAVFGAPGLALVALGGSILFGAAGTLQHVLTLGPLVVGPIGAYRAARWWGSLRGRVVALVFYAVVPLPYDALAAGHWPGLIAYAAAPWTLSILIRLSSLVPLPPSLTPRLTGRIAGLGLLTALVAAVAPAWLYVVLTTGAALFVGSLLVGRPQAATRLLTVPIAGAAVAVVLLLPWSSSALGDGAATFGPSVGGADRLGFGRILAFHTGPVSAGPLGWGLLIAAALPLVIGGSWRLAWAARLWFVALATFAVTWAGLRGWIPVPDPEVVLAAGAAALACAAALGAVAFELDLPGYSFGWRQAASAAAAAALLVGSVPVLVATAGGRWKLPTADAAGTLDLAPPRAGGHFRVLWVGAPSALPLAARTYTTGFGYATSVDGPPQLPLLWATTQAGDSHVLADDLRLATERRTTTLGQLLAPLGVRYIVVPNQTAPSGTGGSAVPTPPGVLAGLALQTDLLPQSTDPSYSVYLNAAMRTSSGLRPVHASGARQVLELIDIALWAVAVGVVILDRRRRAISRVAEVAQPAWFAPASPARRVDAWDPGAGSRSGLTSGDADYQPDEMWVDD
jgi:GT2 family glycosyltransferase